MSPEEPSSMSPGDGCPGRPASTDSERVLQLPLGHSRPSLDAPTFCPGVELRSGVAVAFAGAGDRRLAAARCRLAGIAARHGRRAFALPISPDMRFALAFLLRGAAARFLAFRPSQVAAIAALTF